MAERGRLGFARQVPGFPGEAGRLFWGRGIRRRISSPRSGSRWYSECAAVVGEQGVNEIPQDVVEGDVRLLNAVDTVRFDHEAMVEQTRSAHLTAIHAGNTDRRHPELARLGESGDQIGGIPARREPNQPVATPRQRDQLAHKDVGEANIVADRTHHRGVGSQIDRRERRAPCSDRVEKLHRKVRGVATRPAIAHREHTALPPVDFGNPLRRGDDRCAVRLEKRLFDGDAMGGLFGHRMQQGGVVLRLVLSRAVKERIEGSERAVSIRAHPWLLSSSSSSPNSASNAKVCAASASSIRLIAKPTCTSTQSPTQDWIGCSASTIQARWISRRTPETSTIPSIFSASLIATICPGMPKHMSQPASVRSYLWRSGAPQRLPPGRATDHHHWPALGAAPARGNLVRGDRRSPARAERDSGKRRPTAPRFRHRWPVARPYRPLHGQDPDENVRPEWEPARLPQAR